MAEMKRFALLGKSGSGKSEVATLLCEQYDLSAIKTGSVCREIALLLFGNQDKRSTQLLDDALTTIDPSIFLKAALRREGGQEGFVIDSLRFQSDLRLAQELGCTIVRVNASDTIRVQRLEQRGQAFDPTTDGLHRSETELDAVPVDVVIENEKSLSELAAELRLKLN